MKTWTTQNKAKRWCGRKCFVSFALFLHFYAPCPLFTWIWRLGRRRQGTFDSFQKVIYQKLHAGKRQFLRAYVPNLRNINIFCWVIEQRVRPLSILAMLKIRPSALIAGAFAVFVSYWAEKI